MIWFDRFTSGLWEFASVLWFQEQNLFLQCNKSYMTYICWWYFWQNREPNSQIYWVKLLVSCDCCFSFLMFPSIYRVNILVLYRKRIRKKNLHMASANEVKLHEVGSNSRSIDIPKKKTSIFFLIWSVVAWEVELHIIFPTFEYFVAYFIKLSYY